MEKMGNSHIDRIIGPDENKEGLLLFLDKLGKEKISGELEKTIKDKEIIDFSQKCLDEYLLDFGKKDIYEVPNEKIHIVPIGGVKKFKGDKKSEGVASVNFGACLVDRNISDIRFSIVLFHELYHIKAFASVNINNEGIYSDRRSGFGINVKGEKYFGLINETLNNYLCQKFFNEKIKNSNLFDKKEVDGYILKLPRIKLLDLFEEQSEYLFQKNRDQFDSKDDIKKLFFDADINGNILPIARLIEKTYGEGSFRNLGNEMKS